MGLLPVLCISVVLLFRGEFVLLGALGSVILQFHPDMDGLGDSLVSDGVRVFVGVVWFSWSASMCGQFPVVMTAPGCWQEYYCFWYLWVGGSWLSPLLASY